MTKKTLAITLSVFIAIMPFLGFPTSLKTAFYVVAGLLLAVLIELISINSRKITRTAVSDEICLSDQKQDKEFEEEEFIKETVNISTNISKKDKR